MEEEMVEHAAEEEEEEEEEVEYTFTAYEIDLDYEFDAARFFDFSHDESPLQARQAELWFHSAGSYPPSRNLLRIVIVFFLPFVCIVETNNLSPFWNYISPFPFTVNTRL